MCVCEKERVYVRALCMCETELCVREELYIKVCACETVCEKVVCARTRVSSVCPHIQIVLLAGEKHGASKKFRIKRAKTRRNRRLRQCDLFPSKRLFPFLKIKSVFSKAPDHIRLLPEGPQSQGCLRSLVMVLACYHLNTDGSAIPLLIGTDRWPERA